MKKIVILFVILTHANFLIAQNVGIGTAEPMNKLQVAGNLLVSNPTTATNTAPTPGQIKTMVNSSTITFINTDSTGRIYDPGGSGGNYLANMIAYTNIAAGSNEGIEITVESMDLNTGDSLIIKESAGATTYLMAVGNGYNSIGKWVFNSASLYIIFKSNPDAAIGTGFALLFRRLFSNTASQPALGGFTGNAFFFDTKTGAIRGGQLNNSVRGNYSVALGDNNTASGIHSTALGFTNRSSGQYATSLGNGNIADGIASIATGRNTVANGDYTTAMGQNTTANGNVATALGYGTTATGNVATAMGDNTNASGNRSTAMGQNTTASGNYSTATGKYTVATGYASTAMGDSSSAGGYSSFATGLRAIASGDYSTAMGTLVQATGLYSSAIGYGSNAEGTFSVAVGNSNLADGYSAIAIGAGAFSRGTYSTAIGYLTHADGDYSTAMGRNTTASGGHSTAMGYSTTASGNYSTALGNHVSTNNYEGAFLIGDNSTSTVMNGTTPNNFRARFDGGYRFYTSGDYSTSCALSPGANAWSTTSDMRLKENFETINGEDFLKKIAAMRLVSWNYKQQDPSKFRHYGPMAQDFYAAFGKDKYGNIGNDTTINQADFDGVNLIAIQALEKRTQKIDRLEKENAEMKAMLLSIQKELDEIKVAKK